MLVALAAVAALLTAGFALAPDPAVILPTHTPSVRYSKVTQATISKTVCVKGWTATIRPPAGELHECAHAPPGSEPGACVQAKIRIGVPRAIFFGI